MPATQKSTVGKSDRDTSWRDLEKSKTEENQRQEATAAGEETLTPKIKSWKSPWRSPVLTQENSGRKSGA
jgi:hypothetical protein